MHAMLREKNKAPYTSDCHALHHWLDEKLALDVLRNILDFLLKHPFHSFKQLYIWGFACCKIFIFSHFKECLSGHYNTVSSPGHAASSWVLCVSGRRKQYSWLMTSQRRKKIWKILHVLWLHCITMQTIETTAGIKNSNSMSFWSSLDSSVCDYWMAACQWKIREGCCFFLCLLLTKGNIRFIFLLHLI